MTTTRFVLAASLIALFSGAGCDTTVQFQDDDSNAGCVDPAPPTTGTCAPAWVCLDGDWVDTAGRCNNPCPVERPSEGSACNRPSLDLCSYDVIEPDMCGEGGFTYTVEMMCTGEGWSTTSNYCQPEPLCPVEPPVIGESCEGWSEAYYCDYGLDTACGAVNMFSYCNHVEGEWLWQGELNQGCDTCPELDSVVACSADPRCSWDANGSACALLLP
jgi:hypothetical protein